MSEMKLMKLLIHLKIYHLFLITPPKSSLKGRSSHTKNGILKNANSTSSSSEKTNIYLLKSTIGGHRRFLKECQRKKYHTKPLNNADPTTKNKQRNIMRMWIKLSMLTTRRSRDNIQRSNEREK